MAPSGTQFDQFRIKLTLNHRILLESLQIFSICQLGAIYRHTDDFYIFTFLTIFIILILAPGTHCTDEYPCTLLASNIWLDQQITQVGHILQIINSVLDSSSDRPIMG